MAFARRIFVSAPFDQNLTEEGRQVKMAFVALLKRHGFEPQLIGEAGLAADL